MIYPSGNNEDISVKIAFLLNLIIRLPGLVEANASLTFFLMLPNNALNHQRKNMLLL